MNQCMNQECHKIAILQKISDNNDDICEKIN
jgi:hypothetical protein